MSNHEEQIVLGIDMPKTVSKINADIRKLKNQLAQVKLTGALDTDSTVKKINARIAALESQLKSIDGKGVQNTLALSYDTALQQMGTSFEEAVHKMEDISETYKKIHSDMSAVNKEESGFWDKLKSKLSFLDKYLNANAIFSNLLSSVKKGISSVIELDTALTALKKTTTMTSRELEDYYYASNDAAKQMGVSTKEILEQAAAWSRLGFNTAEAAAGMAQLSAKFAGISPGMSGEQAREGLAGIMKAWGLDISDVEREVMDNINALGKAFGESNADIVAGMKKSAVALAAVGTSYRDAFALFTGAQEVLQNAEAGGRALRSISMRIRGYSEDSEDGLQVVDEELKNIARDLMNLTQTAEHSRGVSIFKEGSATEFKSLVQYFGEINEIWDEMSQKQQNDFLEKAFGKNQAQVGAAFIQNYEAIADAIEAMKNAAGSSEREMSIVMDSLEYKLNHLSETGTSIAQNLFHRDDMKSVIDVLDSFMGVLDKVTEKLGLFGTIGLGAGLFAGLQNVGKPKMLGFNYC